MSPYFPGNAFTIKPISLLDKNPIKKSLENSSRRSLDFFPLEKVWIQFRSKSLNCTCQGLGMQW